MARTGRFQRAQSPQRQRVVCQRRPPAASFLPYLRSRNRRESRLDALPVDPALRRQAGGGGSDGYGQYLLEFFQLSTVLHHPRSSVQ